MTTSHLSGQLYSANGFYGPTYTYATLPAASSVADGTQFWTSDQGEVISDGSSWSLVSSSPVATTRTSLNTTQPTYQENFYGATKIYSGYTDAQTFLNSTNLAPNGIEIGWNAGITSTNGWYVGVQKTLGSTWDLSNTDRIMFEFGWYKNHSLTRINIIIVDGSANSVIFSGLLNGSEKPQQFAQVFLKSQFSAFVGSINWSNITRIDVRFVNGAVTSDDSRSMALYRVTAGGYTKPTVVISCDDIYSGQTITPFTLIGGTGGVSSTTLTVASTTGTIAAGQLITGTGIAANTIIVSGAGSTWTMNQANTIDTGTTITAQSATPAGLNAMLSTCISRKVKGTHFVTDLEILNGAQGISYKMTQSQVQAWCNAGWSICCHNIQHRPFAIDVASYSKAAQIVTMVINWGSSTNTKGTPTGFTLVAGDYITVSRCTFDNVNGTYPVISVTQGASQTTITFDVGNSTAVPTVSVGDGGVISVDKYSVKNDNQLLRTMIKQQGYKTNDAIMAYTYGQNDEKARTALAENGVRIARTTGGNGTNPEYSTGLQLGTTQISRKNGLVLATKNTTSTALCQLNSKMLTLPTVFYQGVLSTVQSNVNALVQTGGLLSIYWHGDQQTDGVNQSDQAQIDLINYLANLRDSGVINLITFDELDAMISARLNPNDIQN